ncbi:MAG: nucleotidyltransferase domain-containing protein [bacterium]|nr:nucleotidyltransferase domain-containing protein [bacterium]
MKRLEEIMEKREPMRPLFNQNQIELAFLFGSVLETEEARDIDIAVLFSDYDFDKYINTYEDLCRLLKTRDIDLVVLNRSNPAIKMEALLKGIMLFFKDEQNLAKFGINTFFEYEDYLGFKREYLENLKLKIKEGISVAQRSLNRERIRTYLSELTEATRKLKELSGRFASFEEFKRIVETRELCVHYLRIAFESVLDVCRHFLAVKGMALKDFNSTNLIELSGEKGLLPYSFADNWTAVSSQLFPE